MAAATPNRTTVMWRRRLGAALRILVACVAVGLTTLYGPESVRRQVAFPAFAYVTAVLIVSEATLGDAIRGTCHVVIGTSLVMGPTMMSLWLIGPARFTPSLAGLAVAVGAFGVAVAESAPILAKRIAFGQMVIVYVGAVVLGASADVVMHPLHVAASTALGAASALLAMLIPFPRLATFGIKRKCRAYAVNATERLNLYVKAIVDDKSSEQASERITEIKTLSDKASRLLRSLERSQDAMLWERPQLAYRPNFQFPLEKLQEVELTLKGMEMALSSYRSQTAKDAINEELKNEIQATGEQLRFRIKQISRSSPSPSSTAPELKDENDKTEDKNVDSIETRATLEEKIPVLFILQCMNYLQEGCKHLRRSNQKTVLDRGEKGVGKVRRLSRGVLSWTSKHNLIFGLKCSLSLGLAVLLGLTYTKKNGYWSGLTIAISFVTSRQATFTVTNARAQGTAIGTIYGILGYFVCHRYGLLKLLCILPWVVFTTFLRHSKMYGESGATSAIIAALLILGRKKYGTPAEFAIARLTEAFIGLSCFIIIEILLRPERAAVLVKGQVSQCLKAISVLLEEMAWKISQAEPDAGLGLLHEKRSKMGNLVQELDRLVREAKEEPNFWFTPFPDECYTTVLESLKKMADNVFFMTYSFEMLCLQLQKPESEWRGFRAQLGVDIELFKRQMSSALQSIQEALSSKNESTTSKKSSCDIEMGKEELKVGASKIQDIDKEEADIILGSFVQHTKDLSESGKVMEDPELKNQILLNVGSIVFCMRNLVTETSEIGKMVKEITRKENL